ncbi:DUF4012 domain-containing protein [Marmoricola sp. URHB0036]|uniref:DUF4012 domain-containing protein n=1 Tax=Marmoricola sp. URHB0036 TaxID=1298863 RepID=UPI000686F2E5|nr:DUF4012 domain-containing protein [Marmoricola sp. URHB0036]
MTSWRRLLLGLAAGLIVLVVLVFSYQAVRTVLALREAKNEAHQLSGELRRDDVAAVKKSLRTIEARSATARSHSDNTLWNALARVPVLGDDVDAVQVMARALNDASSKVYEPATTLLDALQADNLRNQDGTVNLTAVASLEAPLQDVATALQGAVDQVDGLESDHLLGPLRDVTTNVRSQLDETLSVAKGGVSVARLVPPMMGTDGPRHYLLVVQNNAEVRSTGGLPGSFIMLDVDHGKVSLGAQHAVDDFPVLTQPVLPLTAEERALYGDNLGENIRDTNLTPDFPRAAELINALQKRAFGTTIDGVISVDPVVLSAVLRATGPVKVGDDTFTAHNVVPRLLNQVYKDLGTRAEQDAYFDRAARGIFGGLITRNVDPLKLMRQLGKSSTQRRFLVWSAHPEEQRLLAGTVASGELPRDTGARPHVGLYLNDGTAAKIEYYLDYSASIRAASCTVSGGQTLQVGMVLDSSAPRRGYQLNHFITGNGAYAPRGMMRLNLRVYAPTGGELTSLSANGRPVRIATADHDGRQVAIVTMFIRAHQEVRLSAEFRTRDGQRGDPVLDWTPGVRTTTSRATAQSSC